MLSRLWGRISLDSTATVYDVLVARWHLSVSNAKRLFSPRAAVVPTAFYLLTPYGILASRSFQPDPLMIMALLISIFTILRYYERPPAYTLAVAAIVSSLTLFV